MKVLLGRSAGVRVLGVGWLWVDSVFFDDGTVDRVRILVVVYSNTLILSMICAVHSQIANGTGNDQSVSFVYLDGVKMEDASEIVASRVITPTRRAFLSVANCRRQFHKA